MGYLQTLVNGIVLGTLYACLAVGFSLVWGVLNVVNMLHGSLIVFGGYLTFFAWHSYGIHPLLALPAVALLLTSARLRRRSFLMINRVVSAAGSDHDDVDLRPRPHPLQFHDGLLHRDAAARDARSRRVETRRHRHAGRSAARHGAGAAADRLALSGDAALSHRPRHRRRAHGQRRGRADGHQASTASTPSPSASAR